MQKNKNRMTKVRHWETQILRMTFRPRMRAGEDLVDYGRCRQEHLTRNFSHAHCTSDYVHTHCMAQDEPRLKSVLVRVSFHLHGIHDVCLSVRWLFLVCLFVCVFLLFLSVFYLFSSTLYLFSARHSIFNVDNAEG